MNPEKNRNNFSALLLIITFFSFGLIFLRFSQIMVQGEINGEDLEENIEMLYTRNHTLQANRGTIFDRYGNPVAIDATSYKMIGVLTDKWSSETNPQHVTDKRAVANIISKHINLSSLEVLSYLSREADQVEFGSAGNNLSYHTALNIKEDLEEAELTGIIFEERQKRLYPNGTFASHTVGLAQYPAEETEEGQQDKQLVGVMGLEASYNDLLTGTNGRRTYKKDSFGYLIPGLENEEVEPEDGDDLYLTLDHKLQAHLEIILEKIQNENDPKSMTATVMDANTGEILATGQRPSFNATTLENIDSSWLNLLAQYTYEPGSTLKVITLAAAIEEGVFDPNVYYQSGAIRIHGHTIRDFNRVGWGWISHLEGLSRSSNVLFVELVEKMGHDVWQDYLEAFGFGQLTGITLPDEQAGTNPFDSALQKVNTGFGQGLTVTPVQMLQAFSAVVNGGEMLQPSLVKKSVDSTTGAETVVESEIKGNPISPETAEKTLNYLKQATEMEQAVAGNFQKEGYSIAAKTGTAQMVDPATGGYSSSKFIYSVVGMFPAEAPEYVVYITVQEPVLTDDARYGGAVVQKIYHPLVDRIIDFTEEASENSSVQEQLQYVDTPSVLDMGSEEAMITLSDFEHEYTLIGTGDVIVQQFPYPDTPLFNDQQIILMTNGAATMPDLTNWSRNDVLKVAELTGVKMKFVGEGYVVNQDLAEGSYMEPGSEITITLSSEDPITNQYENGAEMESIIEDEAAGESESEN